MKYRVVLTAIFQNTLKDLLENLSREYSKRTALDYDLYLKAQLKTLEEFPYLWPLNGVEEFKDYHLLVSKKNIVFYRVDEQKKIVICEIIASSDQNYLNLK